MPLIALVTYAAAPQLTPDDRLLRTALEDAGADVRPVIWDEVHSWNEFDLVVLRSTWDYFLRPVEFANWVDRLDQAAVGVVNPLPVVRWNGNKRYLLDLEDRGVKAVPTVFVAQGEDATPLHEILEDRDWADAVVKPAISGGAHLTWRVSPNAAEDERFRRVINEQGGGMLVQPFMPEIMSDGELSLIFLDGVFSHAAVKRPKAGDFRVQQEHGGQYAPAHPPADIVEQAAGVVAAAAAATGVAADEMAYARVDGVVRHGLSGPDFLLMELECIEPSLFFLQHPPAATRMARSLLGRLQAPAGA